MRAQITPLPPHERGPTLANLVAPFQNANQPILYEIAQSAELHTIDLSRSLKSELLSPAAMVHWNAVVRRTRVVLAVCHNLVFFANPIALLVPTPVGRGLALLLLPLGIPSSLTMLLSLRYDVLYVLLGTYDFWFYWIVALVTCGSLGLYLGDARAIAAFFVALGMLISILIDASISRSRVFVVSSLLSGALGCVGLVAVQLQLVPDVSNHHLSYNGRTVSLPDIIANGMVTLVVVLARNAYRRREAVRHTAANTSSIRCISFRCTVVVRTVVSTPSASPRLGRQQRARTSSVPHLLSGTITMSSLAASEMKMVPTQERFDGRRMLFGYQRSIQHWHWAARWTLALVSMTTASLTGVLFFYEVILEQRPPVGMSLASFVGSCLVSQLVWAMLQPRMLRRLWMSFDFVFLSFQLSLLHACVCDTFRWDHRALISLAGYIWIHVIMVLDALMPVTRQRIGFHKAFAMVVAFGFAAGHGGFLAKLIFDKHWIIQDRVLYDSLWFGHRLRVNVVPLIVSRQPILIVWSLRILWRIYKSQDGELILIRGAVAYDSHRDKQRTLPAQ